jgi:F-type H+-transporting ATPase subunit b
MGLAVGAASFGSDAWAESSGSADEHHGAAEAHGSGHEGAGHDGAGEHGGGHGSGHDGGVNWFELGSMFVNFALLFGFLGYKLRPMIAKGLSDRRAGLAQRLEEAQRKQAEAEARLDEYRTKLGNLEEEFRTVVQSYEAQARADRERLENEAERAVERLAREYEFTIDQEVRKAEQAIRRAAVEATLRMAESKLKERITDADRRRLTDQYVADLEARS